MLEKLSVTGEMQIPFNRVADLRYNYVGLGLLGHFFRLGDLSFFTGATGGLAVISHSQYPNKITPSGDVQLGYIWQGDNLVFGVYYHLMFAVHYQVTNYGIPNGSLDLGHLVYSFGLGGTI